MTARAVLGKRHLAAVQLGSVFGQILFPSRRILEEVGFRGLKKEQRYIRRLIYRRIPVAGILFRVLDLDRRDLLAADQRIEMKQPLFAEQSDVEVDAIERSENAHRIGAILQYARRHHGIRWDIKLRERSGLGEILELFVLKTTAREFLFAPAQRWSQPRFHAVDGVHGARIIDVVGGDKRSIQSPG